MTLFASTNLSTQFSMHDSVFELKLELIFVSATHVSQHFDVNSCITELSCSNWLARDMNDWSLGSFINSAWSESAIFNWNILFTVHIWARFVRKVVWYYTFCSRAKCKGSKGYNLRSRINWWSSKVNSLKKSLKTKNVRKVSIQKQKLKDGYKNTNGYHRRAIKTLTRHSNHASLTTEHFNINRNWFM